MIDRSPTGSGARRLAGMAIALIAITALSGCTTPPANNNSTGQTQNPSDNPSDNPSQNPQAGDTPIAAPTQAPIPTSTGTPVPVPTPTPAPGSAPGVDPNILFTITATIRGSNGAKARIVQTVYKPVDTTSDMASDTALLDSQCSGWEDTYPHRKFVTALITSKLGTGSAKWSTKDPIGVDMDGYPAWSGQFGGFQSQCATVIVHMGGRIHGVVPVPAANTANAAMGWARIDYGFAIAEDGGSTSAPKPGELQFTACTITLSAYAKTSSTIAAKWPTQAQKNPGRECRFGVGF